VTIIRRNTEKKIVEVVGEDQFRFRRGKGSRDAVGNLRISQQTLELEELCYCSQTGRRHLTV
jgi:hypothetical protein